MSMLLCFSPPLRHVNPTPNSLSIKPSLSQVELSFIIDDSLLMQPVDNSEIKGEIYSTTIAYDYLVYAVGAEVQTFNIPGVKEHACFMKELADAERVRFPPIPLSAVY